MRTRRIVFVAVAWLTALAGTVAMVVLVSSGGLLAGTWFALGFAGLAAASITDASVGAILIVRRPGNVVGLVLLLAGNLLPATFLGFIGGAVVEGRSTDLLAGIAAMVGSLGITPTLIVAGPLLALVFPDGRLPGRRWRWPLGAIAVAVAVSSAVLVLRPGPVGNSLADNPFGIAAFSGTERIWEFAVSLMLAAIPAAMLLGLAAVLVRLRRARGVELAQLKWFVAADVVVGVLLAIAIADGAAEPTAFDILAMWSLSLPPLAVGVAIMRYRLFEIDRLIARTVSWAVVTGVLVIGFAGAVVALQAVLADLIQGQTIAVAASTLVGFALFQPLRRRVQSAVDRRFDRARYDAHRTVAEFADRLREEVDIATVTADLHATIQDAVKPRTVQLWIRADRS